MNVRRLLPLFSISFFAIFFRLPNALAYPEMIRYGYTNCTSCHVAPTGGSVLTAYGRESSRTVLSTWAYDGEERPAYFINQPDWLKLGGDYRSVYVYQNTPLLSEGTYQYMEGDIAAAASWKQWTAQLRIGYQNPDGAETFGDHVISEEHYLMFHATEEAAIRVGRFYPAYGIVTPNHSLLIRDQLNIHQPDQLGDGTTYNAEASYIGDPYNFIVTGNFGRPDSDVQRDIGVTAVASRAFGERYRLGVSYLYGTDNTHNRQVFGPYGLLGFTQQLYLLTELDFQAYTPTTEAGYNPVQWGFAQTNRFGFEVVKGLQAVVDQEFARVNFKNVSSLRQRYGLGLWWYPRPHFQLAIEYQQRQDRSQPFKNFFDYMYLLWHFYL